MSKPELRSDVVDLLLDCDFNLWSDTNTYAHVTDGRPFTRDEMTKVMTAEEAEFGAARHAIELMRGYEAERSVNGDSGTKIGWAEAQRDLDAVIDRYIDGFPDGVISTDDLIAAMTEEDRATYKRVALIALCRPGARAERARRTAKAAEAIKVSSVLLGTYITKAEWDSRNIPDADTLEARLSDDHRARFERLLKSYHYYYGRLDV